MTEFLTVQPAPRTDAITEDGTELTQLPYPLHVQEDGSVLRQDFWRGKPARVVGFAADLAVQQVDLFWREAWRDPERAVGMYLVVEDRGGGMATWVTAIQSVTRHGEEKTDVS